jgi:hypothetical protein
MKINKTSLVTPQIRFKTVFLLILYPRDMKWEQKLLHNRHLYRTPNAVRVVKTKGSVSLYLG